MENIKLVIWDLDETFWNGTISDGEISPIQYNIDLVKTLTDRGIINSICSKNDFNVAKQKLEELGVWEYFVFPSIDWTMKGVRVQNIIKEMQLRPINCLFLDDNNNNLQEAKFIEPTLEIALPDQIPTFLDNPCFKGKDDTSHSRLNQYKVLEQKAQERAQFASNDDFLFQSDIQVEMIEKTDDKLERIYEMIHRNNQLNFTKDRISQEEVNKLFTDKTVRSGVVHVKDKYGDHGIIGCYAIKDGVAKQFVFSCRILGMGVEQWCYAELGYPKITIVGDVASKLLQDLKPAYINQHSKKCYSQEQSQQAKDTPKLIVYGTCPLRPVWAYLQPKLKNAKFAEIDPAPPVCNLGLPMLMSDEKKKELLDNVKVLSHYTFDPEVSKGDYDFLFVTLRYDITSTYKYTSQSKQMTFYTCQLNDDKANMKFMEDFEVQKTTIKDVENELVELLKNMPKHAKLLILTLTEARFPNESEQDWQLRVDANTMVEKLASKFDALKIVDIRKYANTSASFWDPVPEHYNRQIGHSLANDVLEIMNVSSSNKKVNSSNNEIPKHAIIETIKTANLTTPQLKYTSYLKNFKMSVYIDIENPDKYLFRYLVFQNRYISTRSEFTNSSNFEFDIRNSGKYNFLVQIKEIATDTIFEFSTKEILINEFNYTSFCDFNYEPGELLASIKNFNETINWDKKTAENITNEMTTLLANGINVADYFLAKGINEISVYTDLEYGRILLPILHNSNIKIKNIYYDEFLWPIYINGKRLGSYNYNLLDINTIPKLGNNDTLLFAASASKKFNFKIFAKSGCKIKFISRLLTELYTKTFFVDKLKNKINTPKIIAIKTAQIFRDNVDMLNWMSLKSSEKLISDLKIFDEQILLNRIKNNLSNITETAKSINKEELLETLIRPQMYNDENRTPKFKDISGKYLNIKNGFRVTPNQPSEFNKTIYIMGDAVAFGCGVKDNETIASYLQQLVGNEYRVVNYANIWPISEYSKVIELFDQTSFKSDDIVVLLTFLAGEEFGSKYQHWLNFDAITYPVKKVDAYPLFKNINRPDYFIAPNVYTKECNQDLAKLIFENLK